MRELAVAKAMSQASKPVKAASQAGQTSGLDKPASQASWVAKLATLTTLSERRKCTVLDENLKWHLCLIGFGLSGVKIKTCQVLIFYRHSL